jgi:hypothetical protein
LSACAPPQQYVTIWYKAITRLADHKTTLVAWCVPRKRTSRQILIVKFIHCPSRQMSRSPGNNLRYAPYRRFISATSRGSGPIRCTTRTLASAAFSTLVQFAARLRQATLRDTPDLPPLPAPQLAFGKRPPESAAEKFRARRTDPLGDLAALRFGALVAS